MTDQKKPRCIPCVEKRLRGLLMNEKAKTKRLTAEVNRLKKELNELRTTNKVFG